MGRDVCYPACGPVHRVMSQLTVWDWFPGRQRGGSRTPVRTSPQDQRLSFSQDSVGHTGGRRPHRL